MVGIHHQKGVLLDQVQLAVHNDPQVHFLQIPCTLSTLSSVEAHGAAPCQMQGIMCCQLTFTSQTITLWGFASFVPHPPNPYLHHLSQGYYRRWRYTTSIVLASPAGPVIVVGNQVDQAGFVAWGTLLAFPNHLIFFLVPGYGFQEDLLQNLTWVLRGDQPHCCFLHHSSCPFWRQVWRFPFCSHQKPLLITKTFEKWHSLSVMPTGDLNTLRCILSGPMTCAFILLKNPVIQPSSAPWQCFFPNKDEDCIFVALISLIFKTVIMSTPSHHAVPINLFWNTSKRGLLWCKIYSCLRSKSDYTKNQRL